MVASIVKCSAIATSLTDNFVEGTSQRAHISVMGTSDYFDLWVGDGCVDVRVPLTPTTAHSLAGLLLAIISPDCAHRPSAL